MDNNLQNNCCTKTNVKDCNDSASCGCSGDPNSKKKRNLILLIIILLGLGLIIMKEIQNKKLDETETISESLEETE